MGKTKQHPTGVRPHGAGIQIKFKLAENPSYSFETIQWRPTPANLARAGKLREEIVEKIKHGIFDYAEYFPNSKNALEKVLTFMEFAQAWLDSPENNWTPQSRDKFKGILNNIWMPNLHGAQINKITRAALTQALTDASNAYKKNNGKEPSASTYNNWLVCVRGVFGMAIKSGAIIRNADPTQDFTNKKRIKTEADPFDQNEAEAIIRQAYEQHGVLAGAWFEFGFFTGMRCPSEPSALLWDDVDFRRQEVRVTKISTRRGVQNKTKTGQERIVHLNQRSLNALERLQELKADSPLVFINQKGGSAYNAKAQRTAWKKILASLKIRYRDMYNMRHTYATFGLMSGLKPAYMAKQLGHSLEEFFKTYARWINNVEDDNQKAIMDGALGAKWGKSGAEK
jgi:integrase